MSKKTEPASVTISSKQTFLLKGTRLGKLSGFNDRTRHVLGGPGYVAPSAILTLLRIGAGGKGYEGDIASSLKSNVI